MVVHYKIGRSKQPSENVNRENDKNLKLVAIIPLHVKLSVTRTNDSASDGTASNARTLLKYASGSVELPG